jgi:pimeloyl-ACP methyl ester carboxylesterase
MESSIINLSTSLRNNRKVSYKIFGNENENTVVYFHGFGSSASTFPPDIDIFNKYHIRFIAINRSGYGESELSRKYSLEDVADDTDELLTSLGVKNVAVLGYSAGGLYSQVFADKYPNKVSSLNLVSSAIPLTRKTSKYLPINWKIIRILNSYIPVLSKMFFQRFSKKLNKNLQATLQESIDQMVDADRKIALDPIMGEIITKGAIEAYHNQGIAVYYDAVALCGIYPEFAPYSTKVNIWQGGKDKVWTPATSQYLRSKYVNCTYTTFKEEGHLLYLSKWEEIIKAISTNRKR